MTTEKRIDRKSFLASTVAAYVAVVLGACSDEGEGGGTDETGGASAGGTSAGGTGTGGTSPGGMGTGGTSPGGMGTGGSFTASGGLGTGGTGFSGASGSATGGAGVGGSDTGGASGNSGAGAGGSSGGGAGGGGTTFTCSTETNNGTHSHPLTIPSSDVDRGYQDVPYVLEDGGTGHTHTLELEVYEFAYLKGGTEVTAVSSSVMDHTHMCVINCVRN